MPTLVDKDFPDYTLYPVEEADENWVKLNNPLPNTYYRVDNEKYTVKCLVTILADGWHIAWDTCSACVNHMKNCPLYFHNKTLWLVHYIILYTSFQEYY